MMNDNNKCIKHTNSSFCSVHLKSLDATLLMADSLRNVLDQLERMEQHLVIAGQQLATAGQQLSTLEHRNNMLETLLNRALKMTEGRLDYLKDTMNSLDVDFISEDTLQQLKLWWSESTAD